MFLAEGRGSAESEAGVGLVFLRGQQGACGRSRVRRKREVGGQEMKSRRRVQTGWCSAGHWKDSEFFFFFLRGIGSNWRALSRREKKSD